GIDVVREQVRAHLPAGADSFDVTPEGLGVRYQPGAPSVVYDLRDGARGARPPLDLRRLVFSRHRLTWEGGGERGREDQGGGGDPGLPGLGEDLVRLPASVQGPAARPEPAADGLTGVAV